jgi:hypothetical protein
MAAIPMALVWSEGGKTPTSGWMSQPFERVKFGDEHPTWRAGDFVLMKDAYEVWWEVHDLLSHEVVARARASGALPPRRGHG